VLRIALLASILDPLVYIDSWILVEINAVNWVSGFEIVLGLIALCLTLALSASSYVKTDVLTDRCLVLDSVEGIAWVSADTGYCVVLGDLMLVAENGIPVMTA
jgi:hypothetical protein